VRNETPNERIYPSLTLGIYSEMHNEYDAIIIGSGMSGSVAAMEACERGLRTLVLEAGPTPPKNFFSHETKGTLSLNLVLRLRAILGGNYREALASYFSRPLYEIISSTKLPYSIAPGKPYSWTRVRAVNGRGLFWGRLALRHTQAELEAAALDGIGDCWPIKIDELEQYYSKVEAVMNVVGPEKVRAEHRSLLADKSAPLRPVAQWVNERLTKEFPEMSVYNIRRAEYDKAMLSPMLECARATGLMTLQDNSVATALTLSEDGSRATGVEIVDRITKRRTTLQARIIMLGASSFESIRLLFNTVHGKHPNGVGNSSGLLGKGVMDHVHTKYFAHIPELAALVEKHEWNPLDMKCKTHNGFYIPPFMGSEEDKGFLRCYQIEGTALPRWNTVFFAACGEMLSRNENKITIHPTKKDEWGVPLLHIDIAWSDNELRMIRHQEKTINRIIAAMGGKKARLMSFLASARELAPGVQRKTIPGMGIHEVGGARMGTNPKKSVTNSYGQLWDVPNVFVCDGAVLPSMGYQNTTLTIQALAARSAAQAVMLHQCGDL